MGLRAVEQLAAEVDEFHVEYPSRPVWDDATLMP